MAEDPHEVLRDYATDETEDWIKTRHWDFNRLDGSPIDTLAELEAMLGHSADSSVAEDLLTLPFGRAAPPKLIEEARARLGQQSSTVANKAAAGRQTDGIDLSAMSPRALLRTYASILTALEEREVIRSRNAPVGDIAEFLVRIAYEGVLAPPSAKSWDVLAGDGRKIQVKCRLVDPDSKGHHQFSPFRSWDFHVCVFITFDAYSYDVIKALEVPSKGIQALASPVPHLGPTAARVSTTSAFASIPGTLDVTSRLQEAMEHLDQRAG